MVLNSTKNTVHGLCLILILLQFISKSPINAEKAEIIAFLRFDFDTNARAIG